jgi:hypothetical protein
MKRAWGRPADSSPEQAGLRRVEGVAQTERLRPAGGVRCSTSTEETHGCQVILFPLPADASSRSTDQSVLLGTVPRIDHVLPSGDMRFPLSCGSSRVRITDALTGEPDQRHVRSVTRCWATP